MGPRYRAKIKFIGRTRFHTAVIVSGEDKSGTRSKDRKAKKKNSRINNTSANDKSHSDKRGSKDSSSAATKSTPSSSANPPVEPSGKHLGGKEIRDPGAESSATSKSLQEFMSRILHGDHGAKAYQAYTNSLPPQLGSGPDPGMMRILSPASHNNDTISCTIFDAQGNVAAVQRKFGKAEFLSENHLFPRDLRKIDSSNVDVAPIIAVRSDCILINLLHIKALIKSDEVMIFDTGGPGYGEKLSLFMYDLESKLKTRTVHTPANVPGERSSINAQSYVTASQPYEFRALECILVNVVAVLEGELQHHSKVCRGILDQLDQEIDRAKLRDLLIHSKSLTTFCQKALLIRNALDELLDNDDDLEAMYLTENKRWKELIAHECGNKYAAGADDNKSKNVKQSESQTGDSSHKKPLVVSNENEVDTGEIEMLLEAYYKQSDEVVQQAETLINDIKSTEEVVNIILDANRNSLMVYELKVSIYTLGFTVATLIPAFYGMNLYNAIEDSTVAFALTVTCSCLAGVAMIVYAFRKLRLVRKMSTVSRRKMDKFDRRIRASAHRRIMLSMRRSAVNSKTMRVKKERHAVVWKWLLGDDHKS